MQFKFGGTSGSIIRKGWFKKGHPLEFPTSQLAAKLHCKELPFNKSCLLQGGLKTIFKVALTRFETNVFNLLLFFGPINRKIYVYADEEC